MIYLITFLISVLLLYISNKVKSKKVKVIITIISLLLPCVLAGCRSLSIGTDVNVYVKPMYDIAINSTSLSSFINSSWFDYTSYTYTYVKNCEPLFYLLIYFSAKLFNNIHFALFFIEVLCVFPFYFGLKKYNCIEKKEWICMLIYYLVFYNNGLNMMRQTISISFIFYAISILANEKKFIKCLLYLFTAFFYHYSSFISIFILLLYKTLTKNEEKNVVLNEKKINIKLILSVIIIIAVMFFLINNKYLIQLLNFAGFYQYSWYISGTVSVAVSKMIKCFPLCFYVLVFFKDYYKKNKQILFYLVIFLIDITFAFFSTSNIYASRILFFFQIFEIIFFVMINMNIETRQIKSRFAVLILLLYYFALWFYTYYINNSGMTIPYISIF